MNWTIEFGGHPQDVTLTTGGVASREGFIGFNTELVSDPRWRPGMAVILDHSALDTSCLTGRDVEEIAACIVDLDDRIGRCVCAIVTPDAYTDGLTNVSIHYAAPARLVVRTFPSHDRAVEWLAAQKDGRAG